MFRLAHITDPHFRSFAGATVGDFLNKRAVGALNLVLIRRRKHRMELLQAVQRDLRARHPDHLAVTGDLANVSLTAEWDTARAWLEAYGASADITVIPGNHDAYVDEVVRAGTFERIFAPYMTAELRRAEHVYPFVRFRGDVALVGVNSCVATRDLGAWGEIGEEQRARLEDVLTDPEVKRRTRVVLIHHPPVLHRRPENRNLRDREAFVALLQRTGAELVLHGHDHQDERATVAGPGGAKIPIVGAGSASYAGSAARRSRYNVYEIEGRSLTAVTYAHDEPSGEYRVAKRETLA